MLARFMAPVDSVTTVGMGNAPGLAARSVTSLLRLARDVRGSSTAARSAGVWFFQ